jgi:GNAT superfamily N-acetyltransferase
VTDPNSKLAAPEPLAEGHDASEFDSGEPTLDEWLRRRAVANAEIGASKTYVICEAGSRKVVGYYAICMGHVLNQEAVGSMRRNMPTQIPAVIIGRLAVDATWHRKGIGRLLLQDAVKCSQRAADQVSARLVIVHAISPAAETFYAANGFVRLRTESPTYALDLVKLARTALQE